MAAAEVVVDAAVVVVVAAEEVAAVVLHRTATALRPRLVMVRHPRAVAVAVAMITRVVGAEADGGAVSIVGQ